MGGSHGGPGEGRQITITITGNSLRFYRDTNFWFETTFTLPVGTDPKQLHATIKDCAGKDSIGKLVLAIFKIEDGTLTLAGIRTPDSAPEPPINFDSENTMSGRFELRKVQPQKKNAESPTSKVAVGETSPGRSEAMQRLSNRAGGTRPRLQKRTVTLE
jgi:hypothetical protein